MFTFSEIFRITKVLPSSLKSELKATIDPFYYLTQSGKGYNNLLEKSINLYSQPELISVKKTDFGLSSGLYSFTNKTYQKPEESYYFWNLFQSTKNLSNILKIPGVRNIYVFGSSLQGCATQTSDVDIAVQTSRNMAVAVRILVKLYLKIINKDVYTFRFGMLRKFNLLLFKLGLVSLEKYKVALNSVDTKVWEYRHRAGIKIDAGIFFDDIENLKKVFYKPVEHLFMYDVRLFSYYKKGKISIPSLLPIPKDAKIIEPSLIDYFFNFVLYIPSSIYVFWQKGQSYNPNHQVSKNWLNFVPIGPEPKYLVKL